MIKDFYFKENGGCLGTTNGELRGLDPHAATTPISTATFSLSALVMRQDRVTTVTPGTNTLELLRHNNIAYLTIINSLNIFRCQEPGGMI